MTSRIMEVHFTVNPQLIMDNFLGHKTTVKEVLASIESDMGFQGGTYANDATIYEDGSYSISFGLAPVGVGWFKDSPENFANFMLPKTHQEAYGLENISFTLLTDRDSPSSPDYLSAAVALHFYAEDSTWQPAPNKTPNRNPEKTNKSQSAFGFSIS